MKKIPWLILALILFSRDAKTQNPPVVVYQPNLLNAVSVTTASALVSPIGQNQHIATIRMTGGACVAHDTDIQFERARQAGLVDPSTGLGFEKFGTKLSRWTTSTVRIYAYGSAPGVRINPAVFDTVNCSLSVDYTGMVFPAMVDPIAASTNYRLANIDINAAGDSTIVAARAGFECCIFELSWWNAVAKTIQHKSGAATVLQGDYVMPNNSGLMLDVSAAQAPHFCTAAGDAFIINLSAATQLSGWVLFRFQEVGLL